jgi:hypothetical protein
VVRCGLPNSIAEQVVLINQFIQRGATRRAFPQVACQLLFFGSGWFFL